MIIDILVFFDKYLNVLAEILIEICGTFKISIVLIFLNKKNYLHMKYIHF